jgi:hypothetical protein
MNKKIFGNFITLSALLVHPAAHAVLTGPYGGVGLGMAKIQLPSSNFFNAVSMGGNDTRSVGELDGKLILGYNINRFIGIEGSFSDYARSMYQGRVPNGPSGQLRYTMSSLNLAGKAYLPLGSKTPFKLDLYLLGGLAEAFCNVNYENNGVPLASNVDPTAYSQGGTDTSQLRPIFGGGMHYRIPKTAVLVEVEYTRVEGIGNIKTDSRAIPNADLFTFNMLYNFSHTILDDAEIT